MHKIFALVLGTLLPFLGMSGLGQAQGTIEVPGVIQAVDCQDGTASMNTSAGEDTVYASPSTAVLLGDETSIPFCSLDGYVGAPATAWLVAEGNQFVATQIEVTGPVAVAPASTVSIAPLPIWGTVLGTILVGGLVYLLVHGPDGAYYRYPYWGAYYHHYYQAHYRPYRGSYAASAPVVYVAEPITGVVLGSVSVDHFDYLLARDNGGHVYRYPYYGPYRSYYYRPAYRPYAGSYVSVNNVNISIASVHARQGDSRWDAPAFAVSRSAPFTRSAPWQRAPQQQQAQRQPAPVYRPQQPRPSTRQPEWQPQPHPTYQQQRQPAPANRNGGFSSPHGGAPASGQRCRGGSEQADQACKSSQR